jgi:tetratricopeptide (TPR) repeat protein
LALLEKEFQDDPRIAGKTKGRAGGPPPTGGKPSAARTRKQPLTKKVGKASDRTPGGRGDPRAGRSQNLAQEFEEARQAFRKGRYLKAQDILRHVVAGTSAVSDLETRLRAYAILAECSLRTGQPKEAIRVLMEALSMGGISDQHSLDIRYLLGNALERNGQKEQAVLVYKKVLDIDPNFRDVRSKVLWTRALSGGPAKT